MMAKAAKACGARWSRCWFDSYFIQAFYGEDSAQDAVQFISLITTVRLKTEQNQLVSVASRFNLGLTGLQGA
jgi:hypothetical protein